MGSDQMESQVEEHEQAAAAHGSGMQIAQRHLENAKATTGEEKVQELTDAVEALLLHLRHAEGDAAMANLRRGSEEGNPGPGTTSGGA